MKNLLASLIVLLVIVAFCSPQTGFAADDVSVGQPTTSNGPDYMAGEIIVKFRRGVSESVIAGINRSNNTTVAYHNRSGDFRVLMFPQNIPAQAMVNVYSRNPNVEYAELNHIAYALQAPNDPYYGYQWHLHDAGGIGVEGAWSCFTTSKPGTGVTVAVIDTGVKLGGPDGFLVPPAGGYDFVNNDGDPDDDNGHGTHVAGTIAQNTNNNKGVAGVAYGCSILPVKVLNRRGSGTYDQIASGIYYAANSGAKVINMSLGGNSTSTTLENALAYAYGKGVTIVCAAGNDGVDTVNYPAAYDAYCIAVGATRVDKMLASYSNYGSSLDICAPGGDTSVDQNGDGYGDGVLQETYYSRKWGYWFFQGTSMASPHVAGIAALALSINPSLSNAQVRDCLESTAVALPEEESHYYGWGLVQAGAAVQMAAGLTGEPTPQPTGTMHVADLSGNSITSAKGRKWQAYVTVTVQDNEGNLVEGATVTGTWDIGVKSSATTGATGTCTVGSGNISTTDPSVIFTVTGVSHNDYSYDANGNSADSIEVGAPQASSRQKN